MKRSNTEIPKAFEEPNDELIMSFSHLSSCFASDDLSDDSQGAAYGFSVPREEELYETGYLAKIFLRC